MVHGAAAFGQSQCAGRRLQRNQEAVGGAIIYDTARTNQHKDRYSALAMAVRYISELEEARKRRLLQPVHPRVGVISRF